MTKIEGEPRRASLYAFFVFCVRVVSPQEVLLDLASVALCEAH